MQTRSALGGEKKNQQRVSYYLVVVVQNNPGPRCRRHLLFGLQQGPAHQHNATVPADVLDTAAPCVVATENHAPRTHASTTEVKESTGGVGIRTCTFTGHPGRPSVSARVQHSKHTHHYLYHGTRMYTPVASTLREHVWHGGHIRLTPCVHTSSKHAPGKRVARRIHTVNTARGARAPSVDPSSRSAGTVTSTCRRLT